MHWKDTRIKKIKWKTPKFTETKDGRLDLTLTLSLTEVLETQARQSFILGMNEVLQLFVGYQKTKRSISSEDMIRLFTDAGYPEIAKKFAAKADLKAAVASAPKEV